MLKRRLSSINNNIFAFPIGQTNAIQGDGTTTGYQQYITALSITSDSNGQYSSEDITTLSVSSSSV